MFIFNITCPLGSCSSEMPATRYDDPIDKHPNLALDAVMCVMASFPLTSSTRSEGDRAQIAHRCGEWDEFSIHPMEARLRAEKGRFSAAAVTCSGGFLAGGGVDESGSAESASPTGQRSETGDDSDTEDSRRKTKRKLAYLSLKSYEAHPPNPLTCRYRCTVSETPPLEIRPRTRAEASPKQYIGIGR